MMKLVSLLFTSLIFIVAIKSETEISEQLDWGDVVLGDSNLFLGDDTGAGNLGWGDDAGSGNLVLGDDAGADNLGVGGIDGAVADQDIIASNGAFGATTATGGVLGSNNAINRGGNVNQLHQVHFTKGVDFKQKKHEKVAAGQALGNKKVAEQGAALQGGDVAGVASKSGPLRSGFIRRKLKEEEENVIDAEETSESGNAQEYGYGGRGYGYGRFGSFGYGGRGYGYGW